MDTKFLEFGFQLCDSVIEKFPDGVISPNAHKFTYHQGVLLSGMEKMSKFKNREKYEKYIKLWIDGVITEEGTIPGTGTGWCSLESLDFRQPGILLFNILKKTGKEKYAKVIRYLAESLKEFPLTEKGSFWHAVYCPNEVWLDGLYMASPLMAMYAKEFDRPEFFDMAAQQILTMYETMKDEKGLLHHGYDCTKEAEWADPITGYSQEVWGRAIGWFVVATAEILEYLPKDHKEYTDIVKVEQDILKVVCTYQHVSGRWFQVIDKVDDERNWLENSASCLITAAIAKCVRMGILHENYKDNVEKGLNGVLSTIIVENGNIVVPQICAGTCIESGTMEHYYTRPTVANDMHGTGAFLMMLAEVGELMRN